MRRPVIAGNWKMYKTQAEARAYFSALAPLVQGCTHCDIIVAPPFTALAAAVEAVQGNSDFDRGARHALASPRARSPAKYPPRCWSKRDAAP